MRHEQAKTIEINLTRTIPASPAEVFDAWLDASRPGGPWFGAARAIVQPVVDGLFYHAVPFEGHEWAHYGRFTVLDRPRRIEHTWMSEATRGLESLVTLSIEPVAGQALVNLRHVNVPNDELGRSHQEGWGFVLDALAARFSEAAATR